MVGRYVNRPFEKLNMLNPVALPEIFCRKTMNVQFLGVFFLYHFGGASTDNIGKPDIFLGRI